MKPIVLVDCDGVLSNFTKPIVEEANRVTGMSWTEDDVRTWEIFESIGHPDHPGLRKHCYDKANEPGWCASLEPLSGAQDGIRELRIVADVFVVTSPFSGLTWMGERRQWLWDHFRIPGKHVLQVSAKHLVHGDIFIDDKEENVLSWVGRPGRNPARGSLAYVWNGHRLERKHPYLPSLSSWEALVTAAAEWPY